MPIKVRTSLAHGCGHIIVPTVFVFNFDCIATVYPTVDIFDARSMAWTKSAMSVARQDLASTFLPAQNIVLFAGGTDMALSSGTDSTLFPFSR